VLCVRGSLGCEGKHGLGGFVVNTREESRLFVLWTCLGMGLGRAKAI
jgi:hypothetical protein